MKSPKITRQQIKQEPQLVASKLEKTRRSVFHRFPLLFTLLGTFGVVATFYGFEGIIDQISLFKDHPFILLGIGVATLIFTGTLYKKLG